MLKALDTHRRYLILLSALVICCAIIGIFWPQPQTTLFEMWHEEGANYFLNAYNAPDWWHIITRDDAGYLNTISRLVALVLVRVCGVDYYLPVLFKIINFGAGRTGEQLRCKKRHDYKQRCGR